MIRFHQVCKAYGSQPVLSDVSFAVDSGETLAITGPSGCGKTTLLRCINGLETIDSGQLEVDGTQLAPQGKGQPVNWPAFRSKIAMVFQQHNLFPHLTVMQNITLGPRQVLKKSAPDAKDHAQELLRQFNLAQKADQYPHRLSGGERQRVALVRALAMSPRIMLLDEPTSALDPAMKHEVHQAIAACTGQGLTTIIVSHDMRFIQSVASKVMIITEGQIMAYGAWDNLHVHGTRPSVVNRYLSAIESGF